MSQQTLRDVMTPNPCSLQKTASLAEAARAMRDKSCGSILVTEDDGRVCGIVTDRDLVVRGLGQGANAENTPLQEVCSSGLMQMSPDDSIDDAIKMMANKAIRRIPVVEQGKPMGIVSLGDLAKARDKQSVLGGISAAPPNV